MRALIDNNIQIARTITSNWVANGCDGVFEQVVPVLTDYVLMEYRKTVIRSISLLCDLVMDIPLDSDNQMLRTRLGDILQQIGSPNALYLTPRKRGLIISILGFFLKGHPEFMDNESPKTLVEDLQFWAEELEDYTFYVFIRGSYIENVRDKGNYLQLFSCPLSEKGALYNCKRGQLGCRVVPILQSSAYKSVVDKILHGAAAVYDELKGILCKPDFYTKNTDRSIGERICYKISDTLHAVTCVLNEIGLVTADHDLAKLSKLLGTSVFLYLKNKPCFKNLL